MTCLVCGSSGAREYDTPGERVALCDAHRPMVLPKGWRVVGQSGYTIKSPWERQKP